MADNLGISISVDTAKARADLKLFNAEIANTTKAMNAAVKAGDPAAVSAQRQALQGLYLNQAKATAVIKQNTAATRESTQANRAHTASLKEAGLEFGHLAHAAGLPIEGLRALRAGFAAFAGVELIRGLTAASSKISELIALSRETRFDPNTIQAFSLALERAGGKAEDAKTAVKGFGDAVLEQQKQVDAIQRKTGPIFSETLAAGGTSAEASEALNKAMTEAYRSAGLLDSSLARAGVTAGRFASDVNGMRQALQTAAIYVVQLNKYSSIQADIWSRDVFKKPYADLAPALEAAAKGSLDLLESQLGLAKLTKEQIDANTEYQKTVNALTTAWDAFARNLITAVGPAITFVFEKLSLAAQLVKELGEFFAKTGYAPELSDTARARIADAGIAPRPAGAVPTGQASGGYIRGAGSGTSDSILARLSNGEFVVNARSVRGLGVGFLQGLNSFAAGGLVNVPPIRFAEGGLVPGFAGGGQAMAAFHFESGAAFKLGGPVDVVNAMVTEAHAQQVRSAGVKPSWYAARPSGR